MDNNEEKNNIENTENTNEEIINEQENDEFNGTFHERDSLSENNIVEEVKKTTAS